MGKKYNAGPIGSTKVSALPRVDRFGMVLCRQVGQVDCVVVEVTSRILRTRRSG